MTELLRLAFRNLSRHKVKTVLSVLAIAVSVAAYIWCDSWLTGMNIESRRNIVNYETGAAKIQTKGYVEKLDELPMWETFADWEKYAAALNREGFAASPRFTFTGTLYAEEGTAPVVFHGIEPALDPEVMAINAAVDDGRFIESGNYEIILGNVTAYKLGIEKAEGQPVNISTVIDINDGSGKIRHVYQLISAVVVGTINSPDPQINNNTAYIPLDVLQDENGMLTEGRVTEIAVRKIDANRAAIPGKSESPAAIKAALEKQGVALPAQLDVFDWKEYSKDYIAASAGDNWSTRIMTLILFILSFLGIANTMLLAILERTREIGMLRAQGMTDGQIVFLLMTEAGIAGIIGAALGMIIGCLANIPMVLYGIDFSAMTESMSGDIGYRVNGVFRSAWNVPVVFAAGILAALVAALMAYLPARRALKMPVTEALRFD